MSLNNIIAFAKENSKRFSDLKTTVSNKDKIRYIEVVFRLDGKDLIYNNDNFNIDFKLEIDRTSQSNILELNIYNIKYETEREQNISNLAYDFLKAKPQMYLYAGYKEDLLIEPVKDLVYSGQLVKVKPSYNDLDIAFQMVCVQEKEIWVNQILDVNFPKGKKPSEIIRETIEKVGSYTDPNGNTISLKIGQIAIEGEGGRDIPYKSGFKKSNSSLQKILEEIAKDTYCNFYIENGLLYFIPAVKYIEEVNNIAYKELLSLSEDDEGYNVKTGFKNLRVNTLMDVERLEKKFVINKISHFCDGEDGAFESEFKIIDMDIYGKNMLKSVGEEKKKSEESIKKRAEKEAEKQKKKEEGVRR